MIFAELLTLVGISGGFGLLVTSVLNSIRKSNAEERERRQRAEMMTNDLKAALKSRDHTRLEDWLIVYADIADPAIAAQVKVRRDELYIEKNA